jgi:Rrf2 family protein
MQATGDWRIPRERRERPLDGPWPRNDAGDLKLPSIPQRESRMLSQRAKYALKAMICLAGHGGPGPLSVTEIALSAKIPRAFLEQILSDMKRRNLLVSRRGKQGGFLLARDASKISFADIIRDIDGPLALAPCASRTAYRPCPECRDVKTCELRPALIEARDATAAILEHTTLAQIVANEGLSKTKRA